MRPEPVFSAPWHAQLFAMTVHMSEAGHFTWPVWVAHFSATLAQHGADASLNGGDDYFLAWLETLEDLLAKEGHVSPDMLQALKAAWTQAYLETPHGQPVRI